MSGPEDFAFPIPELNWSNGMTLHDYFAAHAPTPPNWIIEQQFEAANSDVEAAEAMVKWAHAYADAMLRARGQS